MVRPARLHRWLSVLSVAAVAVLSWFGLLAGGRFEVQELSAHYSIWDDTMIVVDEYVVHVGFREAGQWQRPIPTDFGVPVKVRELTDFEQQYLRYPTPEVTTDGASVMLSNWPGLRNTGTVVALAGYRVNRATAVGDVLDARVLLAHPTQTVEHARVAIVGVGLRDVSCTVEGADRECVVNDRPEGVVLEVRDLPPGAAVRMRGEVTSLPPADGTVEGIDFGFVSDDAPAPLVVAAVGLLLALMGRWAAVALHRRGVIRLRTASGAAVVVAVAALVAVAVSTRWSNDWVLGIVIAVGVPFVVTYVTRAAVKVRPHCDVEVTAPSLDAVAV